MPTSPIASTTSMGTAHDGLEQLRRHWAASTPRAAMLLVHGIGEHSGRYEHVGAILAEAGVDVLSFDNRGYGLTGGPRAYVDSFDEFVLDVEELLTERRALGVPVILMGHSLGGLIAATYLVGDRPQPDLAVLSAPALDADAPLWQRVAAPVLGTVAPRFALGADFDGSVLTRDEEVQRAYEHDPLRVGFSTARLGREILRAMKSTRSGLDRIRVPTYVLHGDADPLVPVEVSAPLGARSNVTRRVWPDLRHECLNEPEHPEVLAALVTWLDTQLAG